jgi:lipid-binding SYLF domain-containing protein
MIDARRRSMLLLLAGTAALPATAAWDPKKDKKDLDAAATTVAAFKKDDPGIESFFNEAHAYVVFPTVGKGGVGIGGAYGKGIVFEKGQFVGRASMTQVTVGFQWGGQAYSELLFFRDTEAFGRFKTNRVEFAAQASAVAITLGAGAKAAYDGNGVAVFIREKGGLMYEASLGGQKFKYTPNEAGK